VQYRLNPFAASADSGAKRVYPAAALAKSWLPVTLEQVP